MKLRLYTRQGVTLMLGDCDGRKPDGSPYAVADIQQLLVRGEICIESGEKQPAPPNYVADLHSQAGAAQKGDAQVAKAGA